MAASSRNGVNARVSGLPLPLGLMTDDRLARLVQSGSERAFAMIYERYNQRLYRYTCSILHDGDDARDALQSTLARAFAALQRGKRDAPLCPWLFRIAHNEAISLVRRRAAVYEVEASELCVASAEERAGERTRLAALVADLRELPERQRSALVLRELSGLSHKEIAVSLGISVHTVKHSILDARRSLVECEQGRLMLCEDVQRTSSSAERRMLRPRSVRAHLRGCSVCAALAEAIPKRSADLHALFPALSPALAASLLAHLLGRGTTHGLQSAGVAGGLSCKTVGATLAAKTLIGVSIMAATGAGVTGALALASADPRTPATATTPHTTHAPVRGPHGRPMRSRGEGRRMAAAPVPRGGPPGALTGVEPRSSAAPDVSRGSEDTGPAASSVGHSWISLAAGAPAPKTAGSQRGVQASAGSHAGAASGRPGTRARQPSGPGGAPIAPRHPLGPVAKTGAGANAGHERATSTLAEGPGARPASVPVQVPATPDGLGGQSGESHGAAAPGGNASAPPPAQGRPLSPPGEPPASAG
ncbi:MAG: sigma-70 family polymerase sigma factor [Solirubrobacterales bacterium]|nr:sigma-70 family polymerase sigma factor [Solirubrobacterales bacterium]